MIFAPRESVKGVPWHFAIRIAGASRDAIIRMGTGCRAVRSDSVAVHVFGRRLKQLREEQGLTQADLARVLNVAPNTIATYETKPGRVPNAELLTRMARYFGVSTDYLLGNSDSRRGVPDPLETEWAEGIRVLRRASKRMTPEEKQFITDMIQAYLERREHERKQGK